MNISQQSRWRGIASLLALAALAAPEVSFAQAVPTWTWGVELYRQDSGSIDQFAPFCENADCDGPLTGQTVCVTGPGIAGQICLPASLNHGGPAVSNTAVFTGLSTAVGTFQACLQDATYQLFGVSAGLTSVPPRCASRSADTTVPLDDTNAMYLFKLGTVRVEKFNDLNGNGVRDAGEGPLAGFEFSVTDTQCGTLTTDAQGRASCTSASILAGQTYEVCETPKSGWQLTGAYWGDDAAPQGKTAGPCVTTGALDLPSVDWTVKFGNRQLGSIVIQKVLGSKGRGANPTSAPTPFNFTIANSGGRTGSFSLNLDQKKEYIRTLPPDTYTITEDLATLPENWVSRGANCIPLNPPDTDDLVAEVTPVPNKVSRPVNGDEWLCSFYNARYPLITVKKEQNLGDKPLKGWEIVVRLGSEVIASGTTGKDGTWSGYLTKVSADPKAIQAEYQVCEKLQSDWVAEGAQYELVGGSISGKTKLSVKDDLACFPLTMGYNEDWEVVLTNKRVFPIPLVGPLGLGLGALGLGLFGMWRVRRKG